MGVSPEYFARQLTESGQVGVAITEVLRGKAATVAAEKVKVTDEAGNEIDVKAQIEALNADVDEMLAAQAAAQANPGQAGAEGDIEVSDLSIDVAGTIEAEADDVAEALAADEAAAAANDAEALTPARHAVRSPGLFEARAAHVTFPKGALWITVGLFALSPTRITQRRAPVANSGGPRTRLLRTGVNVHCNDTRSDRSR